MRKNHNDYIFWDEQWNIELNNQNNVESNNI